MGFLSEAGLSRAGLLQKCTEMTEALQKFSFSWRFACWESWRVLVWVGKALQKLFAVAHLLLRQEKENKLSFYLFLIAKVLLRSKYRGLYRLPVWGGLVWRWFITEMDRNHRSITEIFFFLGVLDWALGGCLFGSWRSLVLVGGALQKHFLLRSKSGFWFRSLVWVAERAEKR